MISKDVQVLRALNHLRATHLPSYVALRMLLESVDPTRWASLIDAMVLQATIRKRHRVLELKRFKSHDGNKAIYRNYFIASPSVALADACALALLHDAGALQRQEDVFSYRPPQSRSYGRNFEFFADGYRERNDAIAAAMAAPNQVAVITDIENFYPSIDGTNALRMLLERFQATKLATKQNARVVESAARRAISDAAGGLLIGMEMSHALATVFLSSLDEAMRTRYPSKYFRYVDDIVIVVSPKEVDDALSALDNELELLGLKRNSRKDAVADVAEWGGYRDATKRSEGGGIDCLRQLKFRLKLFLARHPIRLNELGSALRSRNIYLPLDQLMAASSDVSWRQRVREFVRNDWKVIHGYQFDRLEDVVRAAVKCREEVLRLLNDVLAVGIVGDPGAVARRWNIQRARFAINRAFYFADTSNLASIIEFTKGVEELYEARVVCEALLGNFTNLALTPGPAVAAATQLLSLRLTEVPDGVSAIALFGGFQVVADFDAHLSLRGLAAPSTSGPDWPDDLRGLIAFLHNERIDLDGRAAGYGAEVSSLAINYSPSRAREMARTRFMTAESVVFDALSLDSAYGS